mgnify:CR=1 FL=1
MYLGPQATPLPFLSHVVVLLYLLLYCCDCNSEIAGQTETQ